MNLHLALCAFDVYCPSTLQIDNHRMEQLTNCFIVRALSLIPLLALDDKLLLFLRKWSHSFHLSLAALLDQVAKGNLWNHETCRNGAYANLLNSWKFILVSELMIMSHVQLTTNRWVNFDALITNTGYLSKLKIWSTPTKIDLNCLIIPDRLLKIGPRDGCGARFALILRL